jgi:hypothetical protein
MAIFEMRSDKFVPLDPTSFETQGIRERADLQRLLLDRIEVAVPDAMVITEEFGEWDESKRRIDVLALDKSANLVVVELKRSEDRGATELQAIRYAAMVSTMTFDQVVSTHNAYLTKRGISNEAEESILEFLDWDSPDEAAFAQSVRIVLVAESFSKELTTSVMWLNQRDLDIRCVRMTPYLLDDRLLVDVQQTIPLPEAAEYTIQIRKKTLQEQAAKSSDRDFTKYDVTVDGVTYTDLPKRRAIYYVIRHLCKTGISPEALLEILPAPSRRWRSVEGTVDSATLQAMLTAAAANGGRPFESRRWFLGDDELIPFNGRTYVLSNQWGGGKEWFSNLLNQLITSYHRDDISFVEHD